MRLGPVPVSLALICFRYAAVLNEQNSARDGGACAKVQESSPEGVRFIRNCLQSSSLQLRLQCDLKWASAALKLLSPRHVRGEMQMKQLLIVKVVVISIIIVITYASVAYRHRWWEGGFAGRFEALNMTSRRVICHTSRHVASLISDLPTAIIMTAQIRGKLRIKPPPMPQQSLQT